MKDLFDKWNEETQTPAARMTDEDRANAVMLVQMRRAAERRIHERLGKPSQSQVDSASTVAYIFGFSGGIIPWVAWTLMLALITLSGGWPEGLPFLLIIAIPVVIAHALISRGIRMIAEHHGVENRSRLLWNLLGIIGVALAKRAMKRDEQAIAFRNRVQGMIEQDLERQVEREKARRS